MEESEQTSEKWYKVAIIGAGIAGVAAAQALAQAGVQSVILEASDRVGGRIFTDKSQGVPIDQGASWLHGDDPHFNPVAAAVAAAGLRTYRTAAAGRATYDHDLSGGFALYRPGGGGAIDREAAGQFDSWFSTLMEEIRQGGGGGVENASVSQAIEQAMEGQILQEDWRRMLAWFKCRIEGWFAADCDQIPAKLWIHEVLHAGGHSVLPDGYSGLVDSISQGLDVRLKRKVTSIDCSSGQGIAISCAGGQQFRASAAIVTVSLGVLKSKAIQFSPPLPQRKQEAMDQLGIGHQNKIALLFDHIFWPRDCEFLGGISDRACDCSYFLALSKSHDKPVLIYMPVGELALEIEAMSDDGARDFAMTRLRDMIPSAPEPTGFTVSRWGTDPNFLGCYSLDPQEHADGQDAHQILREPVLRRLLFAGEATSSDFPGTVHGAYASGIKAAQAILQEQNMLLA